MPCRMDSDALDIRPHYNSPFTSGQVAPRPLGNAFYGKFLKDRRRIPGL